MGASLEIDNNNVFKVCYLSLDVANFRFYTKEEVALDV